MDSSRFFCVPGANMTLPRSLFNTAKRLVVRNIDRLEDVGGIPFDIIEPVLHKIDRPSHLRDIERRSPQIQGHTSDIWLKFIKRDIPQWQKLLNPPKDTRDWPFVYMDLKDNYAKSLQDTQKKVNQALAEREAEMFERSTTVVAPVQKLPVQQQRRQQPWRLSRKPREPISQGRKLYQPKRLQNTDHLEKKKMVVKSMKAGPNPFRSTSSLQIKPPTVSSKPIQSIEPMPTTLARPRGLDFESRPSSEVLEGCKPSPSTKPDSILSSLPRSTSYPVQTPHDLNHDNRELRSKSKSVNDHIQLNQDTRSSTTLPLLVRHRKVQLRRVTIKAKIK